MRARHLPVRADTGFNSHSHPHISFGSGEGSIATITWPATTGKKLSGEISLNLVPYLNAIGVDAACALFQNMGGSYCYLASTPRDGTALAASIGLECIQRLTHTLGEGSIRIPLANTFLARHFRAMGRSVNDIARVLRISDVQVRNCLRPDKERKLRSPRKSREAVNLRKAAAQ